MFGQTAPESPVEKVCRKSSFLRGPRSYSYAHKYSLNNYVLCAWLDARDKMVSKCRDVFMRLAVEA